MTDEITSKIHSPSPTYLIEAYESMSRHLNAFDESEDARALSRALLVACESLQRLSEDTELWDSLGSLHSEVGPYFDGSFDDALGDILTIERHVLLQAGMSPQYVAQLLDQVAVSERALIAGSRIDPRDRPSLIGTASNLRAAIRQLANETCQRFSESRPVLEPSKPAQAAATERPQPVRPSRAARLRNFIMGPAIIVGGASLISGNLAALAHGATDAKGAFDSAELGLGTILTGLSGKLPR